MNQDELIAKLTPAIGLRRQLNPRINPASARMRRSYPCRPTVVPIRTNVLRRNARHHPA